MPPATPRTIWIVAALLLGACTAPNKHPVEPEQPALVFLWHRSCAVPEKGQVALGEVRSDDTGWRTLIEMHPADFLRIELPFVGHYSFELVRYDPEANPIMVMWSASGRLIEDEVQYSALCSGG